LGDVVKTCGQQGVAGVETADRLRPARRKKTGEREKYQARLFACLLACLLACFE
jgi:hypothetical protein